MNTANDPLQTNHGGDERMLNELILTHSPYLFTEITSITKCRHSAADIMQETFVKWWSKRGTISYDNPGGWLYRVAVHEAYKHLKKESKKRKLLNEFKACSEPVCSTAEKKLISKEQLSQLESIFIRLPQMQKKVFWMSREAGMSRDEIAIKLDISRNTVKVHLTRAQRFFKEQLNVIGLFVLLAMFYIFCAAIGNTKTGFEDLVNANDQDLSQTCIYLKHLQ